MRENNSNQSNAVWQNVLNDIKDQISKANFITWFKKTKLIKHDSQELIIGVPNVFTRKQFETQFRELITRILKNNRIDPTTIKYQIYTPKTNSKSQPDNSLRFKFKPVLVKDQFSHDYRQGLNERYQLDNFVVGSCNDFAFAACRGILGDLGKKYNPLFIYGGAGTGKTHLIQAVGNQVRRQQPKLKVVYATIEQFVQEFTESIWRKKINHFAQRYRTTDVLIIDDIQFIAQKEKTQEEFFHTFNILLEANKQVIISSDKPPEEIRSLSSRLCSRFQMGMNIDIQPPDFETRCAILKNKLIENQLNPDWIGYDCLEFLAFNFGSNVRELEGALKKLIGFCEINQLQPDLKTTESIFLNVIQNRRRRLTSKYIITKVANYYQLQPEQLKTKRRDQEVLRARHLAMYLLRHDLHLSYPKIARSLGRKDHTTAIHAVNKISANLNLDHNLKSDFKAIKQSLKN